MDRRRYVLAVMAAVPQGSTFTPAQLQKLFFLVGKEAAGHTGGAQFAFRPYDYGPFDAGVYSAVEALAQDGLATIDKSSYFREYGLTPSGHAQGVAASQEFTPEGRDYVKTAATWVRSVPFRHLVSAIYAKYPEMKEHSVFRE